MAHLGVSIYPSKSSLEDMKTYLEEAANIGYSRVFTSMLELSDDPSETIKLFKDIITFGNDLGMRTSIDVNPRLFDKLGVSYQDLKFFKDLGVWSIRLDEGFTGLEEAQMTLNPYDLIIELNISRGQHYIDMVMDFGADNQHLIGSHNFYPQTYAGLEFDYFIETTKDYKKHNLLTAAFIDSESGGVGPWPHSDLMVSTEVQRNLSITSQAQLLKMTGYIDDLFISSSLVAKEELEAVYKIFHTNKPVLTVAVEKETSDVEVELVTSPIHYYRGDYSGYMIRSSQTRLTYRGSDFPAHTTEALKKGDVVICNNQSGQYKGELQLILKDRPNDGNYNRVARIIDDCLPILDKIKLWQPFLLIIDKEA